MIRIFSNETESDRTASRVVARPSYEINEQREGITIIRNASSGKGQSNRFLTRARKIYDRAVAIESLSRRQTI